MEVDITDQQGTSSSTTLILPDQSTSQQAIPQQSPPHQSFPQLSTPQQSTAQQSTPLMDRLLKEKDEQINFLKSTNQGLLAELTEQENYVQHIHRAHQELMKVHKSLQESYSKFQSNSGKETNGLQSQLTELQQRFDELVASNTSFLNSKTKKAYHIR